jgi:hypothetical protein
MSTTTISTRVLTLACKQVSYTVYVTEIYSVLLELTMSGKVYFEALDSKSDLSLWVSDGTAAGTYEVGGGGNGGVTGAGATV